MSCIVLVIEMPDENVIKELGVFIDGKVQGYSFLPEKKYKPTKQSFCCTRNLHGNLWNSGRLDYSELSNFFARAVRGEYCAKGTEKRKILDSLMDKEVENLDDHGCPKSKISLMKKYGFVRVTHSDKRPHFTVQRARQICLVHG